MVASTWAAQASSSQDVARPSTTPGDLVVVMTGGGNQCYSITPDETGQEDYQTGQEAQGRIDVALAQSDDNSPLTFNYDGGDPHAILITTVPDKPNGQIYDWRSSRAGSVGASLPGGDVSLSLVGHTGDTLIVLAFARNSTDLPTSDFGAPTYDDVVGGSSMAAWVVDPGEITEVVVGVPDGRSGHYVAAVVVREASLVTGSSMGGPTRHSATPIDTYTVSDATPATGGTKDLNYHEYGRRFWKLTAYATGVIRFDGKLSSNSNYDGYLGPIHIDVLDLDGNSIGMIQNATDGWGGPDTVWFVESGQTYVIEMYSDSSAWVPYLTYRLRAGGIQVGEEHQVPEVEVTGNVDTDMTTGNFGFIHSGSHAHPGMVRDAIVCAWQHARRRRGPLPADPFWVDTCPTMTLLNYSFGGETGHIGDSGVGTGTVGWRYRVDADDIFIGGSMDFTIYMPYGHMNPSTAPDGKYVDLLGNRYGPGWTDEEIGDYVSVQDLYGDDVILMRDPLIGAEIAPVVSMDLIAAVDDDAVLGGVGAGEPKWFFNYSETEPANSVNAQSQGGTVISRDRWVPINPEAEWFNAHCINLELMTDAPPKITGNVDIPLTNHDYVVSGTWSGQYLKWRAYRQPRMFVLYRRPPPAGEVCIPEPVRWWDGEFLETADPRGWWDGSVVVPVGSI